MPRKLIDVNEVWLQRVQEVIPAAIDTLEGLDNQMVAWMIFGERSAEDQLDVVYAQIKQLKRSLDTIRIIF